LLLGQHEERRNAFDLGQVTGTKGRLEVLMHGLDSLPAKDYG
jgi:hypothetical protein